MASLPGSIRTIPSSSTWREWGLPVLAVLALTPLALAAHQYKFVNDDQILYIPFLRRRLAPSLYPGDYFFDQPQGNISLFEDMLVWPVRLIGVEWTMLLGYLLAQALILLCLYGLARHLVSRRAAFLAMILFMLPVSIGGTFVRTYDNYFNPRTLTLPLSFLALMWLWDRRPWRAAVVISLHLLLHPLSGLHTWLVAALLFGWWGVRRITPPRSLIGPGALLLGTLGWLVWNSGGGGALWLDPTWRAVLWQRTPYVFLSSWKGEDWISLGLYLILGVMGWKSRPRDPRSTQLSLAVLMVVAGATLAVGLGADWLGLAPLAQLQLARSWGLAIALAIIFGAELIFVVYEERSWGGALIAALLGVTLYFDRADVEWQPVLAVLLAAVLFVWILDSRWRGKFALGAESALFLVGLGLVLPTLLKTLSASPGWIGNVFDDRWQLPDEALWPAVLIFGVLLAMRRPRSQRAAHAIHWAGIGLGGALAVVACLSIAREWRQRDWQAYFNNHLQIPTSDAWMSSTFQAWRDVQLWAEGNTPTSARFVIDPDEKGFRVFSERSPVVEVKDGAAAMFSRAYALEWDRRMQAVGATGVVDVNGKAELTAFSEEGLEALYRLYAFDYVVGEQPQDLPWPEVYRNRVFVVYAWPGEEDR